jgi:hypothetical protein
MSIFKAYYSQPEFKDRYLENPENAIEVIIPVYHTNELWRINLFSIYREIPVKRLLISDGGVIDNSIDVLKEFPRVEVFNHRHYKSLGKCIAELIKEVRSDWFAYLHSDVYLPEGWFAEMIKHKNTYDWYGCPMMHTVMVNYLEKLATRPYAGSQIGRKVAFEKGLEKIDDDFVYRQEDFVFERIVKDAGYTSGKIDDTFHFHQTMFRPSKGYDTKVKSVSLNMERSPEEIFRAQDTQIRGIVKYLDPIEPFVIDDFKAHFEIMIRDKQLNYTEFKKWVKYTNVRWSPYISNAKYMAIRFRKRKDDVLFILAKFFKK